MTSLLPQVAGMAAAVLSTTSAPSPLAPLGVEPAGACHWQGFFLALALSGGAGVRAALPAFLLSLFSAFGDFDFSDSGQWLAYNGVCTVLGLAVVVEMVADCIPAVDHALHVALALAHPLMGAAVAAAPVYCGGWQAQALMAVTGGTLALLVHSSKALFRVASSGSSGGTLNPVVSTCETFSVLLTTLIVIMHPWVAVGAVALFATLGCMGCGALQQAMDKDSAGSQRWRSAGRDEEESRCDNNAGNSTKISSGSGKKMLPADDAERILLELEEQLDLEEEYRTLTKDSRPAQPKELKDKHATTWSWLYRGEQ